LTAGGSWPDAETQKSELGALMKMALQQRAQWYLIDRKWFKQWKEYVGFDSWDTYNVGENNLFPGPIDTFGLFSYPESQRIKEHLTDELDYVLVPTEAWNKLMSWYGCQPLRRKCRNYLTFLMRGRPGYETNYVSNTYEQLNKPDNTVKDAGLYQGQVLVIEPQNEDGT
uniref:ubiquitinyl hydrolase 1 n=1 Tax=Monodelphis domestica TaxID=13616 RepID=A0A5F8HIE8_MONDO